jgi:Protein of unknown function DUF262/HNH endonuclease
MPANFVNLDALIKRQDMGAGENKPPQTIGNIKHTELDSGANTYNVLRKPDFQRETSIWTPEKVRDLVYAYVNEDLVPAIILWRSPTNDLFVIDGAHRLSSIIAWVNDDYGDGILSRAFFDEILKPQKQAAKKTKELVEEAVGPYKVIKEAFTNTNTPHKYVDIAKKLVNCAITVQRLETPDVANAERSFFKINEQGVPLTATEITLLHSRNCPNAIAARAINQRGTGHPHWKKFDEKVRLEIEKLAQEIYGHCFYPPLETSTVKTAVLPIAGKYHPAEGLGLLLDTINFANNVKPSIPKNKEEAEKLIPADTDGSRTIEYLKQTKRLITRISNRTDTDFMRSLDLHLLIYFYSDSGRHMSSAFHATIEFVLGYTEPDRFKEFTKIRKSFEDFLIEHKDFFRQIVIKTRGDIKAVDKLKAFFDFLAEKCEKRTAPEEIVKQLHASSQFSFLKLSSTPETAADGPKGDFSPSAKSKSVIQEKLANAVRCSICGARVPDQGISFDHKEDKKHGGLAKEENIAKTHHYCNSAKDTLVPYLAAERTEIEPASE